jgi:hypothetical protein
MADPQSVVPWVSGSVTDSMHSHIAPDSSFSLGRHFTAVTQLFHGFRQLHHANAYFTVLVYLLPVTEIAVSTTYIGIIYTV